MRQARTHIHQIIAEFGGMPLSAIRPSEVKTWVARLQSAEMEANYVYALHSRLSQILSDAVHDGLLGRNPCSRRTSPPMGKQKAYVATTEQVWALHDAMPEHLRAAVLLGAFVGLRIAEVSGCGSADVDFIRGVVHPVQQWPGEPLKTPGSDARRSRSRSELALLLAASVQKYRAPMVTGVARRTDGCRHGGRLAPVEHRARGPRSSGAKVDGLPEGSVSTTCATTWRRC